MDGRARLSGRRVLVVEDDWFIATYVADALADAGATLIGPVASAADALDLLDGEPAPDAATLNVQLRDGDSVAVARRLERLDVPFMFLSANAPTILPTDLAARPRLDKPFAGYQVAEAVASIVGG